jgi:hypothetical protein
MVSGRDYRAVVFRNRTDDGWPRHQSRRCHHQHRHRDTALICARKWTELLNKPVAAADPQVPDAGWSTCPICARTWLVTPVVDCMLPACGCYGHDTSRHNPIRPCEPCGLAHARACPKMKEPTP